MERFRDIFSIFDDMCTWFWRTGFSQRYSQSSFRDIKFLFVPRGIHKCTGNAIIEYEDDCILQWLVFENFVFGLELNVFLD